MKITCLIVKYTMQIIDSTIFGIEINYEHSLGKFLDKIIKF
jgi:hypothetical protein